MKAFCPDCSEPLSIEAPAAMCPVCQRKYRVFSGKITSVSAEKREKCWSYQIILEKDKPHLLRVESQAPLSLSLNFMAVFIFYGPKALGLYSEGVWTPIAPPKKKSLRLQKYLLALAYPITILAVLQMIRLLEKSKIIIAQSPSEALIFFALILLIGILPVLWWAIETIFPEGPPKDKMAIPDLFDEKSPWEK